MKKDLISITLLILSITACSPGTGATQEPSAGGQQPTPTHVRVDLTPAQRLAITRLSENSGVRVEQIQLVSTEAVEWPDGCFGVQEEGLACTQVITPGFRVILEANGRQLEYRTNEDGTQIRPATIAMTWKREGGIAGFCDYMTVFLSGEVHANSCKQENYVEERLSNVASKDEVAKLDEWLSEYGTVSVDASDPKGVADRMVVILTLIGTGTQNTVSESAKQELVSFAQELYQKLQK